MGKRLDTNDVVLVTMPWSSLVFPSIQLGTLKSVLDRAGIASELMHLNLTFAEQIVAACESLPEPERLTVDDLDNIANRRFVGEWVFAVPPFRPNDPDDDAEFRRRILALGWTEALVAKAAWVRGQVNPFLELAVELILAREPRVVGFTTSFNQNVASLSAARLLKQRAPWVAIVFGGANCDGVMGPALHRAFPWLDAVVSGEGELVAPPLFEDLAARRKVRDLPGVSVARDGVVIVPTDRRTEVAIDDVPIPDYTAYFAAIDASPLQSELSHKIRLLYESARGCWWGEKNHCTFCGLNGTTMRFRSKPAGRAFEEMATLAQRHHCMRFQVVDNIIDMDYVTTLLPKLEEVGWSWDVFYETKANLKREHLVTFKHSGVRAIQPGIESLSTPILKLMKKGVTALQNIRLLKWCAELEIIPLWNLIFGFPGEAPSEYARMTELVPALVHFVAPECISLSIDRFSPYHVDPARYGLTLAGANAFYRLIYPNDAAEVETFAYTFEARHDDGRDPASYSEALRAACIDWRDGPARTLELVRGPGFVTIDDRRSESPARWTFVGDEAAIYLACDAGARPAQLCAALRGTEAGDYSEAEIREFLDHLVEDRLVYEERGHYLSLAVDRAPRGALGVIPGDARDHDEGADQRGDLVQLSRRSR